MRQFTTSRNSPPLGPCASKRKMIDEVVAWSRSSRVRDAQPLQ
jgi:hypothetical protein